MLNDQTRLSVWHLKRRVLSELTRGINYRRDDLRGKISRLPSRIKALLTKHCKSCGYVLSPRIRRILVVTLYRQALKHIQSELRTYELFGRNPGFQSSMITRDYIRAHSHAVAERETILNYVKGI